MKRTIILFFPIIFLLFTMVIDAFTLYEFNILCHKAVEKITQNLNEEKLPSEGLDKRLTFVCLSGCNSSINYTNGLINYKLIGKQVILLSGEYPEQEFIYEK